jgi:hypothetical protein
MIATPFIPEHLERLVIQPAQVTEIGILTPAIAAALTQQDAWTFLDREEVLLCGGIVKHGRESVLWAAMSAEVGARLIGLTRIAKRYLALNSMHIETGVRIGFTNGCRWAELLGFKRDGFDGSEHYRYVRG